MRKESEAYPLGLRVRLLLVNLLPGHNQNESGYSVETESKLLARKLARPLFRTDSFSGSSLLMIGVGFYQFAYSRSIDAAVISIEGDLKEQLRARCLKLDDVHTFDRYLLCHRDLRNQTLTCGEGKRATHN
jgi:hypothetical protein